MTMQDGIRALQRAFGEAATPPRWPLYVRQAKQLLRAAIDGFPGRTVVVVGDLIVLAAALVVSAGYVAGAMLPPRGVSSAMVPAPVTRTSAPASSASVPLLEPPFADLNGPAGSRTNRGIRPCLPTKT